LAATVTRRALLAASLGAGARADPAGGLARQVGITTASLAGHLAIGPQPGRIALTDMPAFLRGELDMRVIDLNTSTLQEATRALLVSLRKKAEESGCVLTNLKLNQPGLTLDSGDAESRAHALATYRRSIDDAALLGCRWVRVLPGRRRPDWARYVAGLRELAGYAQPLGIRLLAENYGWMESDPEAAPALVRDVGMDSATQPDTGNWSNDAIRFEGLAKAFPLAASCDFKARDLGPAGEHPAYDLRRCFEIGWRAGFRGPWCIEHNHRDRATLLRNLQFLRTSLGNWMKEG
jgi:hypothetical protein